mmetsp:Transcript_98257/g.300443  ORF Transcript_98257/g.300443 Transcript_98257/m.300443 type:complete len:303 (+) Transcript_98257:2320-3228(+)
MQVEADVRLNQFPRYKSRRHHQVIIVDPNYVRLVRVGNYGVSVQIVHVLVRSPPMFIEGHRLRALEKQHDVVESRPQERSAKVDVRLEIVPGKEDRDAIVLGQQPLDLGHLFVIVVHMHPRPSDADDSHPRLFLKLLQQGQPGEIPPVGRRPLLDRPPAQGVALELQRQLERHHKDGVIGVYPHRLLQILHHRQLVLQHEFPGLGGTRGPRFHRRVVLPRLEKVVVVVDGASHRKLPVTALVVLDGHRGARRQERPVASELFPLAQLAIVRNHDVLVLYDRLAVDEHGLGRNPGREEVLAGR